MFFFPFSMNFISTCQYVTSGLGSSFISKRISYHFSFLYFIVCFPKGQKKYVIHNNVEFIKIYAHELVTFLSLFSRKNLIVIFKAKFCVQSHSALGDPFFICLFSISSRLNISVTIKLLKITNSSFM